MGNRKTRHPAFCFYLLQSKITNRNSTIPFGGIAQLVERQLCKLEVRGSNPLASSLISDCRLPISDFQLLKMRACAPVIPNRKLAIENLKSGGSAAERACSSVG
jgi:hypothetical protein